MKNKNNFSDLFTFIFLLQISVLVFFITSCKKENSANEYSAKAVVEAYLVAGQPISVNITKEILCTSTDTTIETINDLNIKILTNNSTFLLIPKGEGNYVSDSSIKAIVGQTYTLEFEYNSNIISASTIIPTKPTGFTASDSTISIEPFTPGSGTMPTMPDPITLNWNNSDNGYFLVVVKNIEETLTLIDTSSSDRPKPNFRNQPSQSNSYNIESRNFVYYGTHDIILFKLNSDYAALYNETGNNSQNLTKPVSNIENGLGIFTGINADTLQIEVTH